MGVCGAAARRGGEKNKTREGENEQGDLPLWIQQLPPQVIGIQLVSHLLTIRSSSRSLGSCR